MDDTVVIVVDSNYYEVSKKKLSGISCYFNSMFNGEFLERYKTTINIKGIDCDAWEEILHYVETGKMRPKPYNSTLYERMVKLLLASDMLLFPDIREQCLRVLVEILSPENSLEILEVASKLEAPTLIRKSRDVALWYADVITYTKGFYNLNADQVEGYLSDPRLHTTHGEWGVWEAVNRWMVSGSDPENPRNKFLPRLIKCLSLKHLSQSDLRMISLHTGVGSDAIVSAAVRALIDNCETAPEVHEFIVHWRCMPQRRLPLAPAVVAEISVGSGPRIPYVVRFDLEERKFTPFLRLDQVETNLNSLVDFKVIGEGSKLYMLGGEIMSNEVSWYLAVWEYDQIFGDWNFLANLRKETRHAAACVLDGDLYVIGGFGRHRIMQDTVSKLSLLNRRWTTCSPLPQPMYAVPCCAFKGKIYTIKTEVYQYDPVLDMWELLDIDLPAGEVFCVATANEDHIFIVDLKKTVYKFNPIKAELPLVKVGRFREDCTQACLVDDYIYSMSQESLGIGLICERIHIRSGDRETLWQGAAGDEIETLTPNHHHGCFPLLMY